VYHRRPSQALRLIESFKHFEIVARMQFNAIPKLVRALDEFAGAAFAPGTGGARPADRTVTHRGC
jgi:hypothetical protein